MIADSPRSSDSDPHGGDSESSRREENNNKDRGSTDELSFDAFEQDSLEEVIAAAEEALAEDEAHGADEDGHLGKLEKISRERDEFLSALQLLQADFENYKKRSARQYTEVVDRAAEGLVKKLLPVLDTFELALAHSTGSGGSEEVLLVLSQVSAAMAEILEKEGLETIRPLGSKFDPNEAEAVAHEPGDSEPVITEVLRSGYRWRGRVLRPAMVKVAG